MVSWKSILAMRIDIITCLPELFEGPMNQSIVKRAKKKGLVELYIHDLRPFTSSKQKSIDDYAYGGGAGMVMMIEPIDRCISALKKHTDYDEIIFMTPDGEKLSQSTCNQLSLNKNIILLFGHYKGIDQRVRDHLITREISIGDYVVLNDESSALTDSFQDDLLAPPVYTRPAVYNGWEVPKVLLSGNEAVINDWRHEAAVKKTKERRPRLLN